MKKTAPLPRPEYPRMQFRRESSWLNLNGTWDFRIDRSGSARERGIVEKKELFDSKIVVPFCPESKLSGVADVDFMQDVWYRRELAFPKAWAGKRILLRFGGVDFLAEVWLDGKYAGSHNGGSAPFALDVTDLARPGAKQVLVVHAHDETRSFKQGNGKQCHNYFSGGCHYTRVTGIWQTVWAEAVHPQGLAGCRTTPNLDTSEVVLEPRFLSVAAGDRFRAVVRAGGEVVAERDVPAVQGAPVSLAIPDVRAWSPSDPFLYDLTLAVERDGKAIDRVESYFAMRKVSCEGNRVLLNVPALRARPGLLPGRRLDRALGRRAQGRHRALDGGGLQRRAPAPEGLRGPLPLLGRPPRLPHVGRIPELVLRRRGPRGAAQLPRGLAGRRRRAARPPVHRRLVAAQRVDRQPPRRLERRPERRAGQPATRRAP